MTEGLAERLWEFEGPRQSMNGGHIVALTALEAGRSTLAYRFDAEGSEPSSERGHN
jgi:hypothetical protein